MVRSKVSEALVPSQLLLPLPQHHVMICRTCRYAIPPHAIIRHLKEIHHLNGARRKDFVDFVSRADLREPQEVDDPRDDQFPVSGLPVLDGLQCEYPGCGHLCLSEKRMKSHWKLAHPPHDRECQWHHAPLQTFFRGNQLRYFTGPIKASSQILDVNVIRTFHLLENGQAKEVTLSIPELPAASQSAHQMRLDRRDTDLLNHYQMYTCFTIATDKETKAVWGTAVVRLAHRHEFVMRGILALTALHLAHNQPDPSKHQELLAVAKDHQDKAMPLYRQASSEAAESNCHAVLTFTHLLILYSFALEQGDEQLLLAAEGRPDTVPSWLHFLRTGCGVLCTVWELMRIGPCKTLALAFEKKIALPESSTMLVLDLTRKFLDAVPTSGSPEEWTKLECDEYSNAASTLALAFAYSQTLGQPLAIWEVLRAWPLLLSAPFMAMMADRHPGALILLAHYAILLKDIESRWYFEGRATKLIQTIADRLDRAWHPHIEGPLRAIEHSVARNRRLLPAPI